MQDTQGTCDTCDTLETAHQRDHYHNLLLGLPNELVLTIATFLDKDSQVLLSLSCKRLRLLLNSCLDLALHDNATKVRFLKRLEVDHPKYLTCRPCGLLFLWRKRHWTSYHCPRKHQHEDVLLSYSWFMGAGAYDGLWVTREVVDLIFRAYEHGHTYGLPLSFLNTTGRDRHGISRRNEARWVDNQLMLCSRLEVEAEIGPKLTEMARQFDFNLCLHLCVNAGRDNMFLIVEQAVASMPCSEKLDFKCPFCETDHELCIKKSAESRMRIVLSVWRNYGRRHSNMPSNEQLFHRDPVLRLDADIISRRNVRAAFESGMDMQSIQA